MPEKCILEAFGTGVPNGNVTVKRIPVNGKFVNQELEVNNRLLADFNSHLTSWHSSAKSH